MHNKHTASLRPKLYREWADTQHHAPNTSFPRTSPLAVKWFCLVDHKTGLSGICLGFRAELSFNNLKDLIGWAGFGGCGVWGRTEGNKVYDGLQTAHRQTNYHITSHHSTAYLCVRVFVMVLGHMNVSVNAATVKFVCSCVTQQKTKGRVRGHDCMLCVYIAWREVLSRGEIFFCSS